MIVKSYFDIVLIVLLQCFVLFLLHDKCNFAFAEVSCWFFYYFRLIPKILSLSISFTAFCTLQCMRFGSCLVNFSFYMSFFFDTTMILVFFKKLVALFPSHHDCCVYLVDCIPNRCRNEY